MEVIPWNKVTPKELAQNLVDKLKAFPWDQYDGVIDNHPNEITLLDCVVSLCMNSNFRYDSESNYMDWNELSIKMKSNIDNFLSTFNNSLSLEEDSPATLQFLKDLELMFWQLNNKNVAGWRVAKLTKALHRKRPKLIPMIDSRVCMAYCFGPKSNLWKDEYKLTKTESISHSIAALHELRKELMTHVDAVKQIIYLAHEISPSIVPDYISNLRCLESLVYWRNR